jgi:hypothetical protein
MRLPLPPHWPLASVEAPAGAVTTWRTTLSAAPPEGPVRVTVRIAGAPSSDVRLAGAGPDLGGWSPEAAPRVGPEATTLSLAAGRLYAMKLVARPDARTNIWESRPNRYLYVPGPAPLDVTMTWEEGA